MKIPPPARRVRSSSALDARRRLDFEALFLAHEGVLRRTARFMTRSIDRAEEALQETFLKAWRGIDSFDRGRPARTWLLTILRRVIFDAARRRRREPQAASLDDACPEGAPDPSGAGAAHLDPLERADILLAIARLPAEFREVVRIVIVEERSYREAADALDVPVGTVMSRLHRGRRILRERLRDYAPARVASVPAERRPSRTAA